MPSSKYERVIWDADGVLIDSRQVAWDSAREIVSLFHPVAQINTREDYLSHFSIQRQIALVGEEESKTLRAMHRLLMRHRSERSKVIEEVIRIARLLTIPSVIVTSAFAEGIRRILGVNVQIFEDISGREIDRKSDLLPHTAAKSRSVYITDSGKDIETCHAINLDSVGVGWGYYAFDEIEAANPTFSVSTPHELRKLFSQLGLISKGG